MESFKNQGMLFEKDSLPQKACPHMVPPCFSTGQPSAIKLEIRVASIFLALSRPWAEWKTWVYVCMHRQTLQHVMVSHGGKEGKLLRGGQGIKSRLPLKLCTYIFGRRCIFFGACFLV